MFSQVRAILSGGGGGVYAWCQVPFGGVHGWSQVLPWGAEGCACLVPSLFGDWGGVFPGDGYVWEGRFTRG